MLKLLKNAISDFKNNTLELAPPKGVNTNTNGLAPILEEIRVCGTDVESLIRPAFREYERQVYAPVIELENHLMELRAAVQDEIDDLVATDGDLIQAVRGSHFLNGGAVPAIEDVGKSAR